jgi:hypothetical protein
LMLQDALWSPRRLGATSCLSFSLRCHLEEGNGELVAARRFRTFSMGLSLERALEPPRRVLFAGHRHAECTDVQGRHSVRLSQ